LKIENKKVKTFEDLKVYQMAREFGRKIEALIRKLPHDEKFRLIPQMKSI